MQLIRYLLAALLLLGGIQLAAAQQPVKVCNNSGSSCANVVSGNLQVSGSAVATTGGATPYHFVSTASTNSQLVGSAGAHTLYGGPVINTTGTIGYLRLYDSATAPTCSSATGAIASIPIPASASAAGVSVSFGQFGLAVTAGLGFCITGGGGDTDATNAPAGIYVNLGYK